MKDKEKQICKHFDEEVCSKLDCKKDCKYYGKANCKTCIHEDICQLRTYSYCEEEVKEKGCEHYQLKLPKGSVVLSGKEWNKYKQDFTSRIYKREVELGLQIKELRNDRDYWREEYQQSCKETAEKIYYKAEKKAHFKDGGYYDKDRYYLDMEDLKEILQQFGVEIKEYKDENN